MYRIQNDKRCNESCQLIFHGLVYLLAAKSPHTSIDSITVTELAKKAGVSRATFYRHFDYVIDVLVWKSDSKIKQSCNTNLLMNDNFLFCKTFFDYWATQYVFLNSLLKIARFDLLLSSLQKNIASWQHLLFKGVHLSSAQRQYLLRIWAVIIWSIMCTWVYRGRRETALELTQIAIHNLPDLYRQDIRQVFGGEVPAFHGELKFITRFMDMDYYHSLGCEDIDWEDMPQELKDDCKKCNNEETCKPQPMRYLQR